MIHGRTRASTFQFIVDRMDAKLSGWKRRLLNKAGCMTLARLVMAAIPAYYMQAIWIPETTCDLIDKTIRDFIWKDSYGRGVNLVKWGTVALPRVSGGLGIRRSRHQNISILGKLVTDIVSEKPSPWASLLSSRYGCYGTVFPTRSGMCSPTYRAIRKASQYLLGGFKFHIGSGRCSFWHAP